MSLSTSEAYPIHSTAILRTTKENLEDLEQSEIRTMLMRLPNLDITRVSRVPSHSLDFSIMAI